MVNRHMSAMSSTVSVTLSMNMDVTESDLFRDMYLWDVALADSPNTDNAAGEAEGETTDTTETSAP